MQAYGIDGIEGNPFIIRFKTVSPYLSLTSLITNSVLKVIHL